MLLCSGCPLWLTARLGAPSRSRNLWVEKRPLVLQTSSGPAVTCAADLFGPSSHLEHRDVSRSGRAHCVRGCATLPEAITLLPSLGDDRPGRLDFQKPSLSSFAVRDRPGRLGARSLHLSCHTGQARSTGLTVPRTYPQYTHNRKDHTHKTLTTQSAVELQCCGGCAGVIGRHSCARSLAKLTTS